MHELSYISRMVGLALDACEKNHLAHVDEMVIRVGEMTGLVPHFLVDYYPQCVKGTPLEGSRLTVEEVPVRVRCEDCGEEYAPSRENHYACPACKSVRGKLLSGREFTLERLIVDDAE